MGWPFSLQSGAKAQYSTSATLFGWYKGFVVIRIAPLLFAHIQQMHVDLSTCLGSLSVYSFQVHGGSTSLDPQSTLPQYDKIGASLTTMKITKGRAGYCNLTFLLHTTGKVAIKSICMRLKIPNPHTFNNAKYFWTLSHSQIQPSPILHYRLRFVCCSTSLDPQPFCGQETRLSHSNKEAILLKFQSRP